MRTYSPGQELDIELVQWWEHLVRDGDLTKLVGSSLWPLSAFLAHFAACPTLLYDTDEHGWTVVAWVFPFMGGGTFGCWIRPDQRLGGSRKNLRCIVNALHRGFDLYPVLINTTKQDAIVPKTEALGYTYVGKIPYLFDGESCHVLYMTKEQFSAHAQKWSRLYGRNG
jgi:hypothetical protein